MAAATISRWARRLLLFSVAFLVCAQLAALAGAPRSVEIVLGLRGFVLGVVFGKAYSLVPSYFDRTLVTPRAPAVHLPIHIIGVVVLAAAAWPGTPAVLDTVGALLWALGVAVFVFAIAATIRSNPLGRQTATSDANADRADIDQLANLFMPVAVAYLLVGSYEGIAGTAGFPSLLGGSPVRVNHLFAAGFSLLLLFAVGYRLLPRFLVSAVPRWLAALTLPAGAAAPALLAIGYPEGSVFMAGAALESLAVGSFAVAYGWLFLATDRDRIGFYGPLGGVIAGLLGIGLGLQFAFVGIEPALIASHLRLNVFGLLGLSIVGVLYQFYPPAVATWPGAGDRLALASIAIYATGLALVALGPPVAAAISTVGQLLVLAAGLLVAYSLLGTVRAQATRR